MNSEFPKQVEGAPKIVLGSLIETLDVRGGIIDRNEVEGVNINKAFVPTVANLEKTDISKYKHVPHLAFAANLMHIGRDVIFPVALNTSNVTKFVSPAYFVFRVKDEVKLLPLFLLMLFRTYSFDRRVWFATDSSIRGNLTWDDMCRVKIPLPPIEVQRAYVDAYKGLTALIEENESLLKPLEETAQACVAECREKWPMVSLGAYLQETNIRNTDGSIEDVRGISTAKRFREPNSRVDRTKLHNYKIVRPHQFAYVPTTDTWRCLAVCLSSFKHSIVVSPIYITFKIKNEKQLLPEYLQLYFQRSEIDRYARFNSWGSARENFNWDDMCRVKIPLPPIEVQRAIVALYHCAEEARKIAEEAKAQLALACPAMIQQASRRC
ncbi:MAG: restriction endonuclease subunit S [Sutterella seckii]|mgnify:FL=1